MSLHDFARFDTNARFRLIDGSPGPVDVAATYMQGDFNLSGLARRLNVVTPTEVRGHLVSLNHAERRYPQIGVSEVLTNMIATAAPGPVRDFLTGTGAYAANIGTMGENRPYTTHLELTVHGTRFGSVDDVLLVEHIDWTYGFTLGRPNTNAWTGAVYGRVLLNGVVIAQEIDADGV